jgi:hypothetical protein
MIKEKASGVPKFENDETGGPNKASASTVSMKSRPEEKNGIGIDAGEGERVLEQKIVDACVGHEIDDQFE